MQSNTQGPPSLSVLHQGFRTQRAAPRPLLQSPAHPSQAPGGWSPSHWVPPGLSALAEPATLGCGSSLFLDTVHRIYVTSLLRPLCSGGEEIKQSLTGTKRPGEGQQQMTDPYKVLGVGRWRGVGVVTDSPR